MVYIAVAVLLIGTGYRIYCWFRVPRSSVRLGMFPKASNRGVRLLRLGRDSFLFPQVMDVDRIMWLFVMLLHLGIVAAFVGHLRLIHEFTPLANALGDEGMHQFSFISGGTVGIVLLISLFYLLMRRFKSPYKDLSTPEDYILLILVLIVVFMGNHLRFFGDIHVTEYREYVRSLLSFSPYFPATLAASGTKWALVTHILFVNILAIYFPFSKLVHFAGTFAVNLIRSE